MKKDLVWIKLPSEIAFNLYGDNITDDTARILQ